MLYPRIKVEDIIKYSADMYNAGSEIRNDDQAYAQMLYGLACNLPSYVKKTQGLTSNTLEEAKKQIQIELDKIVKDFVDNYIAPVIQNNKGLSIPKEEIEFCAFPEAFVIHCLNVNGYDVKMSSSVNDYGNANSQNPNVYISRFNMENTKDSFDYQRAQYAITDRYDKLTIGKRGDYLTDNLIYDIVGHEKHKRNNEETHRAMRARNGIELLIESMQQLTGTLREYPDRSYIVQSVYNTNRFLRSVKFNKNLTVRELESIRDNAEIQYEELKKTIQKTQDEISQYRASVVQSIVESLGDKDSVVVELLDSNTLDKNLKFDMESLHDWAMDTIKTVQDGKYDFAMKDPNKIKSLIDKLDQWYDKLIGMAKESQSPEIGSNKTKEEGIVENNEKESVAQEKSVDDSVDSSDKKENQDNEQIVEAANEEIVNEPQTKLNKQQTLRQKFDINNEQDFEELLYYYAQLNKEYYNNADRKRTPEEISKRRNVNAQFKRILEKKAMLQPENENGEKFENTIKNIESGAMFSYCDLKEVAENKEASLMLFNIMASGVYEKDGVKTRLTQKQRIALASTLEIISEMRLDMNKAKNEAKKAQGQNTLDAGAQKE